MEEKERNIKSLLKMFGGKYFRESSRAILKLYFEGNHTNATIDNKLLAELIGCTPIQASKILSSLGKLGLIQKTHESNSYFVYPIDIFRMICLDKYKSRQNDELQVFNSLFLKSHISCIVERMDLLSSYSVLKNLFQDTPLQDNIYLELNTSCLACCTPHDELSMDEKKFVNRYFSKVAYEMFYKRYQALKWRLEEQKHLSQYVETFYIICIKNVRSYLINLRVKKNPNAMDMYLFFLNNFKKAFQEVKNHILQGRLQILVDFDRNHYNGPLIISGNATVLSLKESLANLGQISNLFFYDDQLASYFRQSYKKLFESIIKTEGLKQGGGLLDGFQGEQRGSWLLDRNDRLINEEIERIKQKLF
ncbi:MAG: hypothetical protein ACTSRW_15380 [Candidatus Helarchaeota archaeon]